MRSIVCCVAAYLLGSALCSPSLLRAQAISEAVEMAAVRPPVHGNMPPSVTSPRPATPVGIAPFSRVALAGGISLMGVNLQAAVNANRYMNVRGVGNVFNYSLNNISVSGFNVTGKLNLATAGVALDVYPWPNHGFRISPGALFYNRNGLSATMLAAGGTSFTLNSTTYYSSPSNPVTGTGSVNLHARNPAPTITIGWGNLISRRGGHFSIPFELGAAMIGDPAPTIAFTGGQVCADAQGTVGCQNVIGNVTLNSNLQAQLVKYQNDLQPLRFYPIISVGVGYSFPIR